MIRVLIADDEAIFRMGIKSCIKWEQNGFEIVGEAANGQEALSLIDRKKPDIVLLDLKMPVMDGIQVMEKTVPEYPRLKFIILSCMNDYAYMRKALKLGACDYLFKPVMETDDILKVLLETKEKIMEQDCQQGHSESLSMKKQHFFQNLLSAPVDPLEIESGIRQLNISFSPDSYICFCVKPHWDAPNTGAAEKDTLFATCGNVISRLAAATECFHFCADDCLMGAMETTRAQAACKTLLPLMNHVISRVAEYTGKKISIGLSSHCSGYHSLHQGLLQASEAGKDCFFTGPGTVNCYTEQAEAAFPFELLYQKERTQIIDCIEAGDASGAGHQLETVFDQVIANRQFDQTGICHFVIMLLIDGMRTYRNQIILDKLFNNNINMISALHTQETLSQVAEEFYRIVNRVLDHIGLCSQSPNLPLILQAQQYVKQHYSENISLDEISMFLNINKNYFCQLYKKETGEGFIDYVTKIRIEKALELLASPAIKTYEVAESVGYTDYRYFCKIFKKHTGMTPSEARQLSVAPL